MPRFKDRVYLQKEIYEKIVKNKVSDKEFNDLICNYIREYINYSIRDTQYKDYIDNINVDILDNGVVKAYINGEELMTINLDENIINGQRNKENKLSRLDCMIDSTIDVQESLLEADAKGNTPTYGSSLDEQTKAQVLENNMNKVYVDSSNEVLGIESGEYISPNIAKKAVLQVYSDVIKWDKNMDENSFNKIVSEFYKQYRRTDEIIEIPSEDFTVEIDGKEEKVSYQDIIVSQKPEIVKENNGLDKMYNIDGSKKELDEILKLRDEEISKILENNSIGEDKKEALVNQLKEAYSNVVYDALLKDNLLDMVKRLGYDKVKEELDKLEKNDIGNLKTDGGDTKKNIEYLQNNKEKIMDKLTPENSEKYEELLNKIQEDMQKQNEAIVNIDKNEIVRLNEEMENLKSQVNEKGESLVEPYDEEELKKADEEREEKRKKVTKVLKHKADSIRQKNIGKENDEKEEHEDIDKDNEEEQEKNTKGENSKEKHQENSKKNIKEDNKNVVYDPSLNEKIENLNKKVENISRNGNVDKEILNQLNDINFKMNNLSSKTNDLELKQIKEKISQIENKVDEALDKGKEEVIDLDINNKEEVEKNEMENNIDKSEEEKINEKVEKDENLENQYNEQYQEETNNIDEKNKNQKSQITSDIEDKEANEIKQDKSNTNVKEKIENKKENEESVVNSTKAQDVNKEYESIKTRVESFEKYAQELSKKYMDKKLAQILSSEKLDTHQKAVEIGQLNEKKQEFKEYILKLVEKVTKRENSLSEYKEQVNVKNKEVNRLQEALREIEKVKEHLEQVEQEMDKEERSNNLGK